MSWHKTPFEILLTDLQNFYVQPSTAVSIATINAKLDTFYGIGSAEQKDILWKLRRYMDAARAHRDGATDMLANMVRHRATVVNLGTRFCTGEERNLLRSIVTQMDLNTQHNVSEMAERALDYLEKLEDEAGAAQAAAPSPTPQPPPPSSSEQVIRDTPLHFYLVLWQEFFQTVVALSTMEGLSEVNRLPVQLQDLNARFHGLAPADKAVVTELLVIRDCVVRQHMTEAEAEARLAPLVGSMRTMQKNLIKSLYKYFLMFHFLRADLQGTILAHPGEGPSLPVIPVTGPPLVRFLSYALILIDQQAQEPDPSRLIFSHVRRGNNQDIIEALEKAWQQLSEQERQVTIRLDNLLVRDSLFMGLLQENDPTNPNNPASR